MTKFDIEELCEKIFKNEELTELENKAMLLDTLLFLEDENFHSHVYVIEKLTGYDMSALEKEIKLID